MFLIGVGAQCLMGKDTLADRLAVRLNEDKVKWQRTAFAAKVKAVLCDTFGVDLDFIEKWKPISECPPGFTMTMRQALQFIGDGFRKIMPNVWLDAAMRNPSIPKIISDIRYVNEFVRCHAEGGMNILIGRKEKLNDDPNGSEAQIRPYVKWCLDNFPKEQRIVDLREVIFPSDAPPMMDKFHVFVRNDGSKEEFFELIDTELLKMVKNFVFEFPQPTKEINCLLSA